MENTDSSYEPVDNQYMFGIMILIYQRKINIFFIKDQIKDYLIMKKKSIKILIKEKNTIMIIQEHCIKPKCS